MNAEPAIRHWRMASTRLKFRPRRGRSRKTGTGNEAVVSVDVEPVLYATGVSHQGGSSSVNAEPAIRHWRMASTRLKFWPHRGRSRKTGTGNEAAVSAKAESVLYAIGVLRQEHAMQ